MAKSKKPKSDNANKKTATKKLNPFEVHVNKIKMQVIGKRDKNDRGLPGVSRAKAIQKRKHTLLQEHKVANKSNKFLDRRIGERNFGMSVEDKNMARFAAVRMKAHKKKSIFNLADDEVLTHRGQTLSEIEKFDDPRSDEEDDLDERSGNLDKDFVEDAHFGGGILRKTGNEGAKTHRELIDQLIAESKKRKAEKQKTKEATLELTEKLDTEWKDLMPLVNKSKKNEEEDGKAKVDDYDKVMRELRFEARGTVSDRLKTEDEMAKEEKEKLEQLENERLQRMQGLVDDKPNKVTHRSADDLDDDFVYDDEPDEEYMLTYNEQGESNVKVDATLNGRQVGVDNEDDHEGDESDQEDEDSNDDDEESEVDNFSDLEESESEAEVEDIPAPKTKLSIAQQENIKEDLLKRKEMMDKARDELPYNFTLPDSYETLLETLEKQSIAHQSIIIERMVKCNHPSLSEGNKDGLGLLFAFLLQYLNDLGSEATDTKSINHAFEVFQILTPHIHDLAQLNPENTYRAFVEVIKEKHDEYMRKKKKYPGFELLIFFKLIGYLFTTSDFQHQIVTPVFLFMEQMLYKCKVEKRRDITYGLFLSTLILEYTALSKRFVPAVICYLTGIVHMCIPKADKFFKISPPFTSNSSLLVLTNNHSKLTLKMELQDFVEHEITDEFKINAFHTSLKLAEAFYNNLKTLPSAVEIFENIEMFAQNVPEKNYPMTVNEQKNKLLNLLENHRKNRVLEHIPVAEKPKALRLYEPKIVEIYDRKSFKVQSREKAERDKLLHKLKREKKGALREIRKDKAFLGRVKINQKIESDKQRREKVKRIYSEAAMQQSELNAIDRKKKKK